VPNWDVHHAFEKFEAHRKALPKLEECNEDTTRLRAIDTLLFDVLGWDRNKVETEKYSRTTGFADYAFSQSQTICLILEAKRSGIAFVLPGRTYPKKPVSFALLAKECPEAEAALTQACMYAVVHGARYVAVSNGTQWLLSLTFVSNQPLQQRSVFVYESIEAIADRFDEFYHCFSPLAISTNIPNAALLENRKAPAPAKLSTSIPNYPVPTDRNLVINELSYVLEMIWDGMARFEKTRSFLEQCYVRPEQIEDGLALATELLEQRRSQDEDVGFKPIDSGAVPGLIGSYVPERPLVVLGRIGRGKSTFLSHLRIVAAQDTLQRYIQLDIDFIHRPDKADQVADFIYDQIESKLLTQYQIDVTADNIVRGALHTELLRFANTPEAVAFKNDPTKLKQIELEYIHAIRTDRHKFLTFLFTHFVRGRDRSIAIFLDNLDRRSDLIQEEAFLRASAMARDWSALIFVCLRPTTFYRSRNDGVLDSIAPKVVSITSPKIGEVLGRRFRFAALLADGIGPDDESGAAMSFSSSAALHMPRLALFFKCCEKSFSSNRKLARLFEAVSNGNTRDLLHHVKEALSSKHLNTSKILEEITKPNGHYLIADHEMLRALLYADSVHYSPRRTVFINLFDIDRADPAEHFTRLLALDFLGRMRSSPTTRGFVPCTQLVDHLCQIGYSSEHAESTLQMLHDRRCCEGRFPETKWDQKGADLRITSLGRYHIAELVGTFTYIDAIVVDTPINDPERRKEIRDVFPIDERVHRGELFLDYLNNCSKELQDAQASAVWVTVHDSLTKDIRTVKRSIGIQRRRRGFGV
jgi:hypothetical protein